jgi:hypothetical protein
LLSGVAIGHGFEPQSDLDFFFAKIFSAKIPEILLGFFIQFKTCPNTCKGLIKKAVVLVTLLLMPQKDKIVFLFAKIKKPCAVSLLPFKFF